MSLMMEWHFLIAVAVIVVAIDFVAIAVCIKSRHDRRKSTTVVIVSLLASDLLFGAVLLPVRIIELWLRKYAVFPYIYAYLLFVSAFNAFYLSFDRYASIIRPLWRRLFGTRIIVKGLLVTWIFPAILSIMPLTWVYVTGYNSKATEIYTYVLLGLLCFMLVSIVILQLLVLFGLFRYWSSSKKKPLRKTQGGCRDHSGKDFKKKLNSSILFICLITTSIITWLPTILYNISPFPELSKVSLFTLMANAIIDPLLIIGFNMKALIKRFSRQPRSPLSTQTTRSRFQDASARNHDADERASSAKMLRVYKIEIEETNQMLPL